MCKYKHLPKGWKVKKLGEISNIKTGKSNAVDADINGKYAFFDRSKKIKKSNRFLFDCESLIIPGEGAQFFPRYYSGKFDLHQRVYVIFNFHNSVHIRFVEYYLIFSHKYFEEVAVGATVKSLRLRHFTEIQIPFPSLSKQKFIVVTLNKTFAKITKAEAIAKTNLQNAKELFESYLNNVFENKGDDWEEKRLEEVCDIRSKLVDPKESQYQDLIHIGAGNIVSEKGILVDLKTAKEENLISGKFLFLKNIIQITFK
jgi:type I restriction enzyme S subunit